MVAKGCCLGYEVLEIHPVDVVVDGEPFCPDCAHWTDVGPEFHDDGLQRWNCGVCGAGPEEWHLNADAAEKAWKGWAEAHKN
jgi:ribosomal protein S27AE